MSLTVAEERRISESAISTSAKLKATLASEKDQRMQFENSLKEQKVRRLFTRGFSRSLNMICFVQSSILRMTSLNVRVYMPFIELAKTSISSYNICCAYQASSSINWIFYFISLKC